VGDYTLTEITVNARARTILFRGELALEDSVNRAEAEFTDVQAYVFDGDALGTILGDILEADPLEMYRVYKQRMQETYSKSGGHAPWVVDEAEAIEHFRKHGTRAFTIESAIGLVGAVWAGSYAFKLLNLSP
jgi:hypothetical protein